MKTVHSYPRPSARRGVAAVWALVVLAVLTVMIGLITWYSVAGLRQAERRAHQVQTLWLARSGIERAAARLLADPDGYTGESVEIIPGAQVRIAVRRDPQATDVFAVTCEARYPAPAKDQVTRSQSRRFRRVADKGRVRLEVLPAQTG